MSDLGKSWKETGSGLGHAFKGLGKTLINTGKKGVDKAVTWAEKDDKGQQPAPSATAEETEQKAVEEETIIPEATVQETAEVSSVAEEIRKLAALKEQGILTEEEFTAKKQQLLGL